MFYPSHHDFYKLYFHFNFCKFVVGEIDIPTYLSGNILLGARDGEEVAGSVDVPSKRNKGSKGNAIKSKILLT